MEWTLLTTVTMYARGCKGVAFSGALLLVLAGGRRLQRRRCFWCEPRGDKLNQQRFALKELLPLTPPCSGPQANHIL